MWGLIPPSDLAPLWRIHVAVMYCSLAAAILFASTSSGDLKTALCGGAIFCPLGFAIGLIWHARAEPKVSTDWLLIVALAFISLFIGVFGYLLMRYSATSDFNSQVSLSRIESVPNNRVSTFEKDVD